MEIINSIVRFLQEGGYFIYPIAFVLVVGLAIAIERWIFLSSVQKENNRAYSEIQHSLSNINPNQLLQQAEQSSAPIMTMIASGVSRFDNSHRREDMEYAMEEVVMEYSLRLEKRIPFLATLANIATLLGLLGTIMGLIAAFSAVANADPAEKANLLSASISVAMNTTAFGLIAAIPLVFIHTYLQGKTAGIIDTMEIAGVKLMNNLSKKANQGK